MQSQRQDLKINNTVPVLNSFSYFAPFIGGRAGIDEPVDGRAIGRGVGPDGRAPKFTEPGVAGDGDGPAAEDGAGAAEGEAGPLDGAGDPAPPNIPFGRAMPLAFKLSTNFGIKPEG